MDAWKNAYFTSLLQDGLILEDELPMEPQDEVGFTYANQNVEEFTQAYQTSAQLGSTSKKPQCGGNFTDEEDKLLVLAYLNISLDAVQGNDQKHKTYWRRVWDYFHEHKSVVSERNENSLMNRWSAIQLSVNKFYGCYAQIELSHQSGVIEEDKVLEAKTYYKSLDTLKNSSKNSSFQFEHCWKQLRYQPKWLEDFERRKPKKNKTWTVPSPSTPELVVLGEGDATFVDLERPPGTKGILTNIKEEQKKASDKKMDIIQQLNVQEQKRLQLGKEKLHQGEEKISIKQKMLRVEEMKEEERIMLVDTSALPHVLQEYYQSRQREILQQRETRIQNLIEVSLMVKFTSDEYLCMADSYAKFYYQYMFLAAKFGSEFSHESSFGVIVIAAIVKSAFVFPGRIMPKGNWNCTKLQLPLFGSPHFLVPSTKFKYSSIGIRRDDLGLDWLWRSCKKLKKLQLRCCKGIGYDTSVSSFVNCFKGLQEVELRICGSISDEILSILAENGASLSSLLVHDGGSRQGLLQFITHSCCNLRKLDLQMNGSY
ncbi:hypothetical protein RHSIM_Rhsim08G0180400 [Rhododendron simsii]|uniref:No apical meristem-associated C-terminal domain-containing protein n=1 Tax=Rhododendron simsii TaxID=118357 RepID=A0A834LH72_RHOSS|nr:hypothetical protein RHSIM_Rhsim08G0180400 [Rhododendron simsii]